MSETVFTKIIKGEIPCEKIYEDDKVLAFLDIKPITPGHVLVVSKKQVEHFDDLPDEDYQAVFRVVKLVAKQLKKVLGAKRACVRIEGFDVLHTHVHVYPCATAKDFYGDTERLTREPDFAALAEMGAKLRF